MAQGITGGVAPTTVDYTTIERQLRDAKLGELREARPKVEAEQREAGAEYLRIRDEYDAAQDEMRGSNTWKNALVFGGAFGGAGALIGGYLGRGLGSGGGLVGAVAGGVAMMAGWALIAKASGGLDDFVFSDAPPVPSEWEPAKARNTAAHAALAALEEQEVAARAIKPGGAWILAKPEEEHVTLQAFTERVFAAQDASGDGALQLGSDEAGDALHEYGLTAQIVAGYDTSRDRAVSATEFATGIATDAAKDYEGAYWAVPDAS